MEITSVNVFPVQEPKLRAFVSIVIDGCFMVNDIKIIKGRDGLFISMPSRRKRNGEFKDIAHPLNNATRNWIEDRILSEYGEIVGTGERRRSGSGAVAPPDNSVASPVTPPREHQASAEPSAAEGDDKPERSLEEVEKEHLSESFWTVT